MSGMPYWSILQNFCHLYFTWALSGRPVARPCVILLSQFDSKTAFGASGQECVKPAGLDKPCLIFQSGDYLNA